MSGANEVGQKLDLYISSPQACDYLERKEARNIFISPEVTVTPGIYDYLLGVGFRRSGHFAYRPHCTDCRSCISCRVDTQRFKLSKSQKRILQKNKQLTYSPVSAEFYEEHYALYMRYQTNKHPGGSMANFSTKEYKNFLCKAFGNSTMFETRLDGELLAVSVTDVFINALSAVYTFFDPDYSSNSLGTYCILKQIESAAAQNRQYVYLGYYIKDSNKMSYKANFRPIELLIEGEWQSYDKDSTLAIQSANIDSPLSF
jgi:arginyl-tRNA--protein-N-Asp/Glu arginylyltransferase